MERGDIDKGQNKKLKDSLKDGMVLAAGFVFLLIGVVWWFVKKSEGDSDVSVIIPVLLVGLGELFLFLFFVVIPDLSMFFFGLFFVLTGMVYLVMSTQFPDVSILRMWPVIVVVSGVSLLLTGLYKTKRLLSFYAFPSGLLILLGVCFLLFSLNVFRQQFKDFILQYWPLVLVFLGLILVVTFLIQQTNRTSFPYLKDESGEDESL